MASTPELAFLTPGSNEWNRAWEKLVEKTGDSDRMAENPQCFEIWQYMGSCRDGFHWLHEFRHRCHPKTQKRIYVQVLASPTWNPALEK